MFIVTSQFIIHHLYIHSNLGCNYEHWDVVDVIMKVVILGSNHQELVLLAQQKNRSKCCFNHNNSIETGIRPTRCWIGLVYKQDKGNGGRNPTKTNDSTRKKRTFLATCKDGDFARNWGLNQQELWVPAKTGAPSLEVGL